MLHPARTLLALVFLLVFVVVGCEAADTTANVESGARKIATFEGGSVTQGELQEFAEQSGLGEAKPGSPEFEQVVQQAMPQLVDLEVAKAYAQEEGITVSDREVDEEIETIKDQISEQAQAQGQDVGREAAFEQALEGAGLTEAELRQQIRETLPVQKVQEQVSGDAQPSDQEVQRFYDENRELQYTTPAQRCARHILFNKDQENKAEDIKRELEDGGDFAKLAEENSQDPGSAENGGDLGCQGEGAYVKPFEEAVWEAEEGEILGPVETEFGFHVIEVTDIKKKSARPLDEVEGEIREQLVVQKQDERFADWLRQEKKQRDVKYLKEYRPKT